jgi:hypothetical protein
VKLKACIPDLLIILEHALVGNINFSHYLKILVPQDVHFTFEIRPREDALKSLKILEEMLRELGWKISAHPSSTGTACSGDA